MTDPRVVEAPVIADPSPVARAEPAARIGPVAATVPVGLAPSVASVPPASIQPVGPSGAAAFVVEPAGEPSVSLPADGQQEPASGSEPLDRPRPSERVVSRAPFAPDGDGRPAPVVLPPTADAPPAGDGRPAPVVVPPATADAASAPADAGPRPAHRPAPDPFAGTTPGGGPDLAADGRSSCTAAQLRRFIKSRAYVPLHELRRRFELSGDEDDVSPIELGDRRLFVGLPHREARLLGELLEAGDVGYELLLDPASPLVVGVFPMRPVPRT